MEEHVPKYKMKFEKKEIKRLILLLLRSVFQYTHNNNRLQNGFYVHSS